MAMMHRQTPVVVRNGALDIAMAKRHAHRQFKTES